MIEKRKRKMSSSTSTKRVVINSIIYSFSGILLKCFSFFLLPLYTAYLTTEDYGITTVASSFTSTMSFVVALFTYISSITWCAIFIFFRRLLSKWVFSGIEFFPIILVCLLEMVFICQVTIFDDILKSQQKAMASSLVNIASFLAKVGLNIYFIVFLHLGALGSLLSTLIIDILYTLVFSFVLMQKRMITLCIDISLLKSALAYSIPIIPHNLATRIAVLISKVLIGGVTSLASLGIYAIASQFGDIADTLQGYVDKAYQPWLYEKLSSGEADYKVSIRRTVQMLISVLGLLFIGIALFAQDYIILFVNKDYMESWKYIPLIVLVYAIKTAYYFYVEVLFYYKSAAKVLFTATLSSSIMNVLLSYVLIPIYGIAGSIMADAIAMVLRVAIVIIISKRFDDIGLYLVDFIHNFLLVTLFIVAGLVPSFIWFSSRFSVLNFGHKSLIVILYVIVFLMRFRNEVGALYQRIKTRKNRKV